jgi:hypothetical protein
MQVSKSTTRFLALALCHILQASTIVFLRLFFAVANLASLNNTSEPGLSLYRKGIPSKSSQVRQVPSRAHTQTVHPKNL